MRERTASFRRRVWFGFLQRIALPLLAGPLRLWVRSWRLVAPPDPTVAEILSPPRIVLAMCHGMFFHMLAFAPLFAAHGRRPVVLVSPSRDGDLLAAVLARFDVDSVRGTQASRGVAGSREFLRAVEKGALGIVAIDGPRGPACVAKPGFLRLANAADAHLVLAATSARIGFRFGSWDRAHLPLPGARVTLSMRLCAPSLEADESTTLVELESTLLDDARAIRSPILPPPRRPS